MIHVNIKQLSNKSSVIEIDPNVTVNDLKSKIAEIVDLVPERQRLIHNGKILKDDKTLSEYNIEEGHTVILLKRSLPSDKPAPPPDPVTQRTEPEANSVPPANAVPDGNFMSAMFQNNPQLNRLLEQNPQLRQTLNNPNLMREHMATMSNPSLRREALRNQDLSLIHI